MNTSREGKTMHSFKKFLEEESKNENLGNVLRGIGKGLGKVKDHIGRNKLPYGAGGIGYAAKKGIDKAAQFVDKHKDTIKKVAVGGAAAYAGKKTYDAMKNKKTSSGCTNFPKGQERIRQMQKQYGKNDAAQEKPGMFSKTVKTTTR